MLKNSRTHQRSSITEQSMSLQTPLGSVMEFARRS
jgi:hypothetical protein